MHPRVRVSILVFMLLAYSVSVVGQLTTGALTGTVKHEGAPLPGVTITIASPAMQGTRTAHSYVNGDYNFDYVSPGAYAVSFEMQGMSAVTKTVTVGLARTQRVNAVLTLAPVAEAVTVVAAAPSVVETTEVQANYTHGMVEELPMPRGIYAAAQFAPGTTLAPSGLSIGGSPTYDSYYLINGAVATDSIFGGLDALFVEDAVQETSVLVGSISAEYGRFTGGVISAITKSGGNDFSGSFRDSFSNLAWSDTTDFGEEKARSDLDETYEATLGGRIVRDRLWFFLAGRYEQRHSRGFYTDTKKALPGSVVTSERHEYKVTGQIGSKQSIVGSWLDNDHEQTNVCIYGCWDDSPIDPVRWLPRYMAAARYSGVLSTSFLVEAGYSTREFRFHGSGGDDRTTDYSNPRDIALGSWAYDWTRGGMWGSPVFCGQCEDEVRENEYYNLKGTYYLATANAGTHNITAGYESFMESRFANNYQSGSNFGLYIYMSPPEREPDGTLRPIVSPGDIIMYAPIPILSEGSDFVTESLFVNDKWDLGAKWSFNIGVRYDLNDGVDSAGHPISKSSKVSPRLGLIHDIRGDGQFRVNASYSTYVSKIWEAFGGANGGGNPSYVNYEYRGPAVGGRGTGLGSFDVLEQVFAWFLAQGGIDATHLLVSARASGVNFRIEELDSPSVDEWTVGFGAQLGQRGIARIDYVDRAWDDFYATSTTVGDTIENPLLEGRYLDMLTYSNTDRLERSYKAVIAQASWRPTGRFSVGGNYTWSESKGNQEGFVQNNVEPANLSPFVYPEYKYARFNPVGYLSTDQTHNARLWASYDQPLGAFGRINFSLLESYDSGRPYSAFENTLVRPYVTNPGYATPPLRSRYFFSDRGEYRWDTATATDVAVNYELPVRGASVFVQAQLLNAFNEQAQTGGNTGVRVIAPFNPFTETPKECPQGQATCSGFNWQKRATFGKATEPAHYQLPRTYRFSAGVRF